MCARQYHHLSFGVGGVLGVVVGGSFFLLFTEPVVATETGVFPDDCQNVRRTLTIIKSDLT